MQIERCIAGIDVHKKMLAVVVGKTQERSVQVERAKFGTTTQNLEVLRDWLQSRRVEEVVMESTGQYHKPVWLQLEDQFRLHLAQAQSNRGPKSRKGDFADALRLVKRFLSDDLILSYVPDVEQRLWRRLTRTKTSLGEQRKRVQLQVEALLEDDAQVVQCSERSVGIERTTHLKGNSGWRRGSCDASVERITCDSRIREVGVTLVDGSQFAYTLPVVNRPGVRRTLREELGRIPRVSRLMALALKFQGLLSQGTVRSNADLAALGHVSRTRVCQILRLTNLAPAIQETLLFLPKTVRGPDRITENRLRGIASLVDWDAQRVREKEPVTGPERRDSVGVGKWEDVEIEFLSDERVLMNSARKNLIS